MDGIDSSTKALIALQYVEEASIRKKELLVEAVGDPSKLTSAASKQLILQTLGDANATNFHKTLDDIDRIINNMKVNGVHWLTFLDDEYPEQLLNINGYPLVLFLKGDASLLKRDILAVVGTRRPTRYGIKVTEEFTKEFARAGLVIVSGFARGIDGVAHKVCVNTGSPTIAVFACGLDTCYPSEHRGLMESVLNGGGLIVSEYPLGVKPLQYRFPERNRIISGLARGVFLPEAAEKSGSLITMNLAIEQGREMFVVPANIYSEESFGSNALIHEYPDCLTFSPEDVLEKLNIKVGKVEKEVIELSLAENQIVEALHAGELHFESLLNATGLAVGELTSMLINLELNGIIEKTSGNYYELS